jgi:hypothetical protein
VGSTAVACRGAVDVVVALELLSWSDSAGHGVRSSCVCDVRSVLPVGILSVVRPRSAWWLWCWRDGGCRAAGRLKSSVSVLQP